MKKNYFRLIVALLFATNLTAQNIPSYVPTNGLVGWWPFNGNANDESGNGNNGIVYPNSLLTSDRLEKSSSAYLFDGTTLSGILTSKTFSTTLTEMSASVWFNSDNFLSSSSGGNVLITGNNNFPFHFDYNSGSVRLLLWDLNGTLFTYNAPSIFLPNTWHNVAFSVMNNSSVLIYIDGNEYNVGKSPTSLRTMSNSSILFGISSSSSWPDVFKGKIDDIAIYNRPLTKDEITELFSSKTCSIPTPPIISSYSICSGNSRTLLPSGATGTNTYKWYDSATTGNTIFTSSVPTPSFTSPILINTTSTATTKSYWVSINNGTCESVRTRVDIVINPNPTINLTSDGPTTFCIGNYVNLKSNVNNQYKYQWFKNDQIINGSTTAEFKVIESGNFHLEVSDQQCKTISNKITVTVNPIKQCLSTKIKYQPSETVKDADGNSYGTVIIGKQIWISSNLRTTKFLNGDSLNTIPDGTKWYLATNNPIPAWCFSGGSASTDLTRGKLYNWYAVNDKRNVCPNGYRVPSNSDWDSLVKYLDPSADLNIIGTQSRIAGAYLKDTLNNFWNWGNIGATNITGFSARPAGIRGYYGNYYGGGAGIFLWTNTENGQYHAFTRGIDAYSTSFSKGTTQGIDNKSTGGSVRCMKDLPSCNLPAVNITTDGPTTFCVGNYVNLKSNINNQYKYQWFKNDQIINGSTSAEFKVTESGNFHLEISDQQCKTISNKITVTVNPIKQCLSTKIKYQPSETVKDADGNSYGTVIIGKQIWISSNLRTTKFLNGDSLNTISDGTKWYLTTNNPIPAWCFSGGSATTDLTRGKLYNWYAVNDKRNVCPNGYRVPTNSDWDSLVKYLDPNADLIINGTQSRIAGAYLKDTLNNFWNWGNIGATNITGFSARPAGIRGYYGNYYGGGDGIFLWANTENGQYHAYAVGIEPYSTSISKGTTQGIDNKSTGGSVRCMKYLQACANVSAPTTNAASQNFCQIDKKKVSDLNPSGADINWYKLNNPGVKLNTTDILVTGDYYARRQTGTCESDDSLKITVNVINPIRPTTVSTTQNFCQIDQKIVSDLDPSGSTIQWYKVSQPSTKLPKTELLTSAVYFARTNDGICESNDSISITVNLLNPTPPTASTTIYEFKSNQQKRLNDLVVSGELIKWYKTPTGGTELSKNSLLETGEYYASNSSIGCESLVRLKISISIKNNNVPSYIPSNGLVGWWPFNGNTNDESGNENHGTLYGATLSSDRNGEQNRAYNFDGVSNYIKVPNSQTLNIVGTQITMSYWINSKNSINDANYKGISKGGYDVGSGYEFMYRNSYSGDNGVISITGGTGIQSCDMYYNVNAINGKWMHLAVTFNDGIVKFYVNGTLQNGNNSNSFSKFVANNNDLFIGKRNPSNSWAGFIKGQLDDIAIYNRALTQEEITDLYLGKACTTPIATITPQSATSFCSGGSVNINAATNANYTYQWLNNGATISAATTATYKATTSGKYSVIVKNNSGCIDTSSVVTVNVSATPSLPILTGPSTLCYNSKAIFKASIAGGTWGVANDYLLISSPQGLFRNNKMPPSNLYKTGVTYTLKSKDQLCSVTAQKSVWIRNVAATSVTLTANKQTLKVGEEVAVTATTKITGNLLYWLSASTSFVSVAGTSSPYIAIVKGLRPVSGANITFSIDDLSKGCRNSAFLPFTVTAAASMVENESNTTTYTTDLNVYPNPSNGMVTIENIGDAKTISLIDVTGRVLKTNAVNADRMRLDYSTITKGNYFISIQGETIKEMKSIVIE